MKTPHQLFREHLALALLLAEVRKDFPGYALEAVRRLELIESGPGGTGGNTGYIGANEPFTAIADYVGWIYDGYHPPAWIKPYL